MANEITVTQSLKVVNGENSYQSAPSTAKSFDQTAGGGPTPGYLTIGTTEESEAFSELSTLGWCRLQNTDATNFVEWGFSTTVYGGRLEPGEQATFRLNPGSTLFLKADTAACKVKVDAFED